MDSKVVVVTGGAGLLGRTFCAGVASRGDTVIVTDIDVSAAESVADSLRAGGASAFSARLDITDTECIDTLIDDLRTQHGRIDAVVNSAYPRNSAFGRKLEDVDYRSFCENVNTHLGGYFLVSQRFALDFRVHGGGSIVNLASIYGLTAPRFELYADTDMTMAVEYAAIKAGIIHLTRYFAQYFKHDGVRCNAIAPGGIRDSQPESFVRAYGARTGSGGLLEPDDVSGALLFLLSDDSHFMNGQVLVVDDGWSL